ncbi:hypothetical protein MMC22_011487, partial [Lobaria immixta]|nr:hypothetical protein [Lobaria immixta]
MSLNIFCFVYFLASTFPAVLSAPQTSDQTPNAILDGERLNKDAEEYGGTPLNLFNPGNNVVVALKDDGSETPYTTDGPVLGGDSGGVTFKNPLKINTFDPNAPLLAQITTTPSEYAAGLRARPKFNEEDCH